MSRRINSNKPFSGKCNIRSGAGPIYNKFCPTTNIADNKSRGSALDKPTCIGSFDNLVNYVWEIDLSNGNHTAYVDCDYVS